MPTVSLDDTRRIGDALRVNWDVIPVATFQTALQVELEHADVTGGDLMTTGRIALAHLREDPYYYTRHARIEAEAEEYWSKHTKPSPTFGGAAAMLPLAAIILLILIFAGTLAWAAKKCGQYLDNFHTYRYPNLNAYSV